MPKTVLILSAVIAAAIMSDATGAPRKTPVEVVTPRPLKVEVVTPRPLKVEVVTPRRSRNRRPAKPIPAPTQSGNIPKISDPLDGILDHYRNADNSIPGVVQYCTYSFKIVRVISDSEGIFAVYCRSEVNSAATREHSIDNRRIAEIYIKGFDLSQKADKDIIPLENGKTLWQVGVYRKGKRSYRKYTTNRNEAQKYADSHKEK